MGAVTAIKLCFFPLNVPVCSWSMVNDMNLYGVTGWSSLYASRWAWLMFIDWQLTQVEVTLCSNNSSDCFKDETTQCPGEFKGLPQSETRVDVYGQHKSLHSQSRAISTLVNTALHMEQFCWSNEMKHPYSDIRWKNTSLWAILLLERMKCNWKSCICCFRHQQCAIRNDLLL